jgi:excisionase family DNA binding protein
MHEEIRRDQLLNVAAAAQLLGVKVSTIRRLTADGAMPVIRPTGRRAVRYSRLDLQELIRMRSQPICQRDGIRCGNCGHIIDSHPFRDSGFAPERVAQPNRNSVAKR